MIGRHSNKEQWAQMGRYGTVGIEMGLCIVFGWFLGEWIGGFFDAAFLGGPIGLMVGIVAAFKAMYRTYKMMVRDQEEARDRRSDHPS
jgi:hypothetical protein